MENPWKYRLLTLLLVLLVITNIATMAFIWFRKPPHGPDGERGPKNFLIRELKMTDEQQSKYELLIKDHRSIADAMNDSIKLAKERFFDLMKQPQLNDSLLQHHLQNISIYEQKQDLITFYHFRDVRGILTPEQQQNFDNIINDALSRKGPPPPPLHGDGERPPQH